jgi:general secretion pathway protein F
MARFAFKAVNRDGETVEGVREAPTLEVVIAALQGDGLIPIRVVPDGLGLLSWLSRRSGDAKQPGRKDVTMFSRELATLLSAGLPLDKALSMLVNLAGAEKPLGLLAGRVLEKVKGGAQFSQALEAQEGVFSRFYLNLVRAGELGGALDVTLERLSEYLERSKDLRDTVVTALIYPLLLLIVSLAALMVLLTFVVPQFEEMFSSAGKELPFATRIVIAVAEGVRDYGWLGVLLVIGGVVWARWWLSDSERRLRFDRKALHWPVLGGLWQMTETANLSRTLATLLTNGVPLLHALSVARETLGNRAMIEAVSDAVQHIRQGGVMSGALLESGAFPEMAMQLIRIGEESGHLAEMLERVANTFDREARVSIQRALAFLEPALIIGLGIVIAGIIISILMAILSVNDLAF